MPLLEYAAPATQEEVPSSDTAERTASTEPAWPPVHADSDAAVEMVPSARTSATVFLSDAATMAPLACA